MKPLVSILIPAYNAERWIAETVQSAIAQTWPRKEIVIVDDGSTDQTFSIARTFASKEVRVVSKENHGAAGARNYALSLSQGDYIQWLDADDLLSPEKVAKQMRRWANVRTPERFCHRHGAFLPIEPITPNFSNVSLERSLASRMAAAKIEPKSVHADRYMAR